MTKSQRPLKVPKIECLCQTCGKTFINCTPTPNFCIWCGARMQRSVPKKKLSLAKYDKKATQLMASLKSLQDGEKLIQKKAYVFLEINHCPTKASEEGSFAKQIKEALLRLGEVGTITIGYKKNPLLQSLVNSS